MKLGNSVLLEIVAVIQNALIEGKDASDALRSIEVKVQDELVELTEDYVQSRKAK